MRNVRSPNQTSSAADRACHCPSFSLSFHFRYTGLVGVCVLIRCLALHSCNPLPIQKSVTHASSSYPLHSVIHGLEAGAPISLEKLTVILIAPTSPTHYGPLVQIFTLAGVKWHLTSLPITAGVEES